MVESVRSFVPTTRPPELPTTTPSRNGETFTRWWSKPKKNRKAQKSRSALTQQAVGKEHAAKDLHGAALENQIRKGRIRWLRSI